MKRAIKIFMPVQTWYWERGALLLLTLWQTWSLPKNLAFLFVFFFLFLLLALSYRRTRQWIIKQSSWSLVFCFFFILRLPHSCRKMSGTLLETGWRSVVGGGLKTDRKNKTQATQNKEHGLHSAAPFCIPVAVKPDIYWQVWKMTADAEAES